MTWETVTCNCGKTFANLDLAITAAQCPYCSAMNHIEREPELVEQEIVQEPIEEASIEMTPEEIEASHQLLQEQLQQQTQEKTMRRSARRAIAALALGIISLPGALFWVGMVPGIIGFILGLRALRNENTKTRRRAITGMVLCGIGSIFTFVWILVVIPWLERTA